MLEFKRLDCIEIKNIVIVFLNTTTATTTVIAMSIAIVTLLYSHDYFPGALTLGSQLRKAAKPIEVSSDEDEEENTHISEFTTCILVSSQLLEDEARNYDVELLRLLYDQVIPVNSSEHVSDTLVQLNKPNLELLDRPELSFTFLKIELWRLTQFAQIVYLDCDCLLVDHKNVKNTVNAFLEGILACTQGQDSHEIGASPDCGWPDMFNSGVFTLVPDRRVYDQLAAFVLNTESIDGADQGVLNQFFNPACQRENHAEAATGWIRLPFAYNMTIPNAGYQNVPAVKYFRDEIKLVHFIGKDKPWTSAKDEDDTYRRQWWHLYLQFAGEHPRPHGPGDECDVNVDNMGEALAPATSAVPLLPPQWDATKEPPPLNGLPEAATLDLEPRFEWSQESQLLEDELPKLQLGPKPVFPWESYTDRHDATRVFPA
ncbi:LAFA_0G05204g1_1 [Lachancea sp. 'fantastica']|nr:LAFA_0G05204g1_1 [Lachancea sp. 'fantastica']